MKRTDGQSMITLIKKTTEFGEITILRSRATGAVAYCHGGDGQAFLENSERIFDAIIIDAFAGDKVPANLCSLEFFRLARRRLAPSGSLFLNIFVAHDLDAD